MFQRSAKILDQLDPFCIHFNMNGEHQYVIVQRKGKHLNSLFEGHNLEAFDVSNIDFLSKDTKIPVIQHVIDSRIRQKFVRFDSHDSEEINEWVHSQASQWFGQNRLRQSDLDVTVVSKDDTSSFIRILVIPKDDSKKTDYPEPYLFAKKMYQGLPFEKKESGCFIINSHLFFHHNPSGYTDVISLKSDHIEALYEGLDHIISKFKEDTGLKTIGDLIYYSTDPTFESHQFTVQCVNESPYFLSILWDYKKLTPGSRYIEKQRLLKAILCCGALFLVIFIFSEAIAQAFKLSGDSYQESVLNLSDESASIQKINQSILENTYHLNELSSLIKNRSHQSMSIHTLSRFFSNTVFLKSLSIKDQTIHLKGFARTLKAYTSFIQDLKNEASVTITPIHQSEMRQPELGKKENIYFNSVIYYEIEVTLDTI